VEIARRAIGWAILTAGVATLADFGILPATRSAPAYGAGGAIGAWNGFQWTDRFQLSQAVVLVTLVTLVGVSLALNQMARWVVRMVASVLVRVALGLDWSNRLVARINNIWITALERLAARRLARRVAFPEVAVSSTAEPILMPEAVVLTPVPVEAEATPVAPPRSPKGRTPRNLPTATPTVTPTPEVVSTPTVPTPTEPENEPTEAPITITRAATLDELPKSLPVPPPSEESGYQLPSLDFLKDPEPPVHEDHEQRLRDRAALLEKTFADFDVCVKVVGIHTGPVITQYEISLETGLRLNKVTTLADDLALNLGVPSVRIVAPLPGRTTVGVEVPNDHRQMVRLKELILGTVEKAKKFRLPLFLGKDVEGRPLAYDMATMPHLLIAGRTGTGKSVCLNTVILSFLYSRTPDECRLILIDPKQVEFTPFAQLPHLMLPVVTKNEKAEAILAWAVEKMEERYELLRKARVRNLASYNELSWEELVRRIDPQSEEERQAIPRKLSSIVIVIDEVADLIMAMRKEVESHIIRLAQKSRAAGIHLILATQRPTVDVITGLIKSNLPARVCFQVSSRADSMVVLDEKGAEKLLGMGDMLFLQPGVGTIVRGQGAYVDDAEIEAVTAELSRYEPMFENELLNLKTKAEGGNAAAGDLAEQLRSRDPLYEQAVEVVIREQRGSTSLLQRALGIGYGKASRFIDWMAEDGFVGAYNGSNARDVLVSAEEWESRKAGA
jgi:S-DNA-T family DNA segregation ATPase FtsK/SpoIIIE